MLINIITRTHNRPNYFKVHKQSVDMQTYKDIRHIVGSDVDCPYHPDVIRYNQLEASGKHHHHRAIQHEHTPRNLYINTLLDEVKEGYCIILDDDDIFLSPHAVKMIVENIKGPEQMVLWKVKFPYLTIPRMFGAEPIVGDIATCGYAFDIKTIRKHKIKMGPYSGSDGLFAYDLYQKAKDHVRVNFEFTGIQKQDGMHNYGENDLVGNGQVCI